MTEKMMVLDLHFYEDNIDDSQSYITYQIKIDNRLFWIAESIDFKGCAGQGETEEQAIKELKKNKKIWIETAKKFGIIKDGN